MVSKKKIQMMTWAEAYKQKGYARDAFAERFYKNDYIGYERLKSKIWLTVFFVMYLAFVVVKDFYVDGVNMLHYDYQGFVVKSLIWYLVLSFVVSGVTALVCGRRYEAAKKRIDEYHKSIEQILDME